MGKYRSKLQIIADILRVVEKDIRKTRIMYQANLSYKLLNWYLDRVIKAGLVKVSEGRLYTLTKKGETFLRKFEEYCLACRKAEQKIRQVQSMRAELEAMCLISKSSDDLSSSQL